jgi:DNA mismatch repair protein MutL
MPKIQQLDPHVADLIAAGEVVERPASVVKELMENAIDAGATAVTVEIQRGGMSYIRVTDNGCGIAPEDTEIAFLRHATSKIRNEYDLESIGTLGFRGEALAAISAVSHMELLTRRPEDDFGTALLLDAGVPRTKEEAGGPVGTTMIVRDLFFNTPARLKFMKRDAAEGAAVFAVVQHTALSHPEVAVTFVKEGKQELQTPGDGQLKSVLYAVLGRDVALGYTPVKGSGEEITVEGFVSLPACCRGTRGYQHFFVNGRYIKSRTMTAALEEAYKNQKMVGKFPGCVLHITTKLNAVDVNVHPTKTEVKFVSEKKLFDGVYYTVKAALEEDGTRVQMTLGEKPAAAVPSRPMATPKREEPIVSVPRPHSGGQTGTVSYPGKQNFFQTMTTAEYKAQAAKQKAQEAQKIPTSTVVVRDTSTPAYAPRGDVASAVLRHVEERTEEPVTLEEELPVAVSPERREEKRPEPTPEPVKETPAAPVCVPEAPAEPIAVPETKAEPEPEPIAPPEPTAHQEQITLPTSLPPLPQADAPIEEAESEEPWRIVGELFNTYIVVEQGDKALLIDKHAAHERMNFDRLKAQGYRPMAQQLLCPKVFTPEAEEGAALLQNLDTLLELGFECEDFGDGAILVRQVPYDIDEEETENTLTELASKLMTAGTVDPDAARDDLLHTIACKAAIKGGQKNGPEELRVVAQAVMADEVRYCPHGRPVAIELTRKQLEKQFKRA